MKNKRKIKKVITNMKKYKVKVLKLWTKTYGEKGSSRSFKDKYDDLVGRGLIN